MGDKSYEVSGDTTEWDDILIKKGITTKENVLIGKGLNPEDVRSVECSCIIIRPYKSCYSLQRKSQNQIQ